MFPNSPMLPEIIYYQAAIAANLSEYAKAIPILKDGIKRFPEGEFSDQMKEMLEALERIK